MIPPAMLEIHYIVLIPKSRAKAVEKHSENNQEVRRKQIKGKAKTSQKLTKSRPKTSEK